MLKSMTAYGRAVLPSSIGRFSVEIQCVNRRFLEISVSLPRDLLRFEQDIKKWVASKISRGQVNISLVAHFVDGNDFVVTPNLPLARQLKVAWKQIAEELDLVEESSLDLTMLAQEKGLFQIEEEFKDEGACRQLLEELFETALVSVVSMRQQEGKALASEIDHRLQLIVKQLELIEENSPHATTRYREKLLHNLEDVLPGASENEERILREVAVYAERIDITEELTRLRIHLEKFHNLLSVEDKPQGKTLDFLTQELLREINTIGSKSSDVKVTHAVVDVKSELEKIREQLQNVE